MRLLHIGDDGSLTFTESLGDDQIPKYAILSHTWGKATDEVSFQDILDGNAPAKVGFRKIRFCAEQAERDGLRYIWVDTCCINKHNFTELQESINSMFKWYKKAQVCYAYLQDVSMEGREEDSNRQDELESKLRSSKWFTRGWTLQELIAPPHVVLYSKDGIRLGDKCSLLRVICEITKIPAAALQGAALESFSITERFSWQESRQTTREEDKAYALFGICNVNLPLIYSEGRENAFRRLKNEIDSISKGAQWQDFGVTFAIDEVMSVEPLVARQSELGEMRRVLHSDGSRRTVVIHGLEGMGKTQLMIAFAKRHREDYSAVFWLNAKDNDSMVASFTNVARQILRDHPTAKGLESVDSPTAKDGVAVDAVRSWLSLRGNTRWLMLFDNLDNPKIPGNPDPNAVDIRRFLPSAQQGFVALTTRSSRLDFGHQIGLQKFQTGHDSLQVLAGLSGRSIPFDDPATTQLLNKLDGVPIALATTGAYLRQSSMDVAEYLQLHDEDVAYTTYTLGKTYKDQEQFEAAEETLLRALQSYEIVHGSSHIETLEGPVYNLALVYEKEGKNADAERMYLRAIRGLDCAPGRSPECPSYIVFNLGHFYVEQDRLQDAEQMLLRSLRAFEVKYGPRHIETLRYPVFNLGRVYSKQGRLKESVKMYRRALRGFQTGLVSHEDHIVGDTLNNLGTVYLKQAEFRKAKKWFVQALKAHEAAYGSDHLETACYPVVNLAETYACLGQIDKAEEMYRRALVSKESMPKGRQKVIDIVGSLVKQSHEEQAVGNIATKLARRLSSRRSKVKDLFLF